jgi:pyridoxal phosphate enzyme (YggS family)
VSDNISEKIIEIRERIRMFENRYHRAPNSVSLLAVSKTQSASKIQETIACGQFAFGENYLQEAIGKIKQLGHEHLQWHFIGPIQSNKTRSIAEYFDWVHSIDRLKVALRLNAQRPAHLAPLKVLIQINLDHEDSKAGIRLDELPKLAESISKLDRLVLVGLMSIPAPGKEFDRQRYCFRQLKQARDALIERGINSCRELSMGMSADYEAAIAEGASIIRIGTDIFGLRNNS